MPDTRLIEKIEYLKADHLRIFKELNQTSTGLTQDLCNSVILSETKNLRQ